MNGKLVDWADAKIHVASHVVHYGSAVFEGARCYDTLSGPGLLQAGRAHAPAVRLRADLPDGGPLRSADADRRDDGPDSH